MSMEKACITTPLANNALQAPESTIFLGETAGELSEHCIYLIENETARRQCAKEGRNFVTKTFKWTKTTERLNEIFKS